jgi:hypothetical protein
MGQPRRQNAVTLGCLAVMAFLYSAAVFNVVRPCALLPPKSAAATASCLLWHLQPPPPLFAAADRFEAVRRRNVHSLACCC